MTAQEQAECIVSKLQELGVKSSLVSVTEAPQLISALVRPENGTRMMDFTRLKRADDLAFAIGAQRVRISAPVPGEQGVGIEWNRADRQLITLDDLPPAGWPMTPTVGLDTENRPVVLPIIDAPHLMVSGQSGGGKSSFLHTVLCSLLEIATPEMLSLILVDPKRVEMTAYEGLPHLAAPVADEAELAVRQLAGVAENMDRRYKLLQALGARNWTEGNEILWDRQRERLPYILVVIDELAELVMTSRKEVESLIVRLAQKGRAAGIHLILATQYPKSDILSGLIRVNLPTKVAFAVPDQVASRVAIDRNGAESLLGRGDALLSFGGLPVTRFQAAFCSQEDVAETVSRWTNKVESTEPRTPS